MAKVAYLLGAGASALRLPVIASMAEAISEQLTWLAELDPELQAGQGPDELDFNRRKEKYKMHLQGLAAESVKYVSVDTYARWLSDEVKLSEVKATLSMFFALEQLRKGYDPRYESFVSTLLDHEEKRLNPNAIILTWNYDQHIAQVLRRATNSTSLKDVMSVHAITTLHRLHELGLTQYHVLHLNGIAGMYGRGKDIPLLDRYEPGRLTGSTLASWMYFFETLSQEYYNGSDMPRNLLHYSWEAPDVSMPFWNEVTAPLKDVKKLVVIGYSFPDLNRAIDRRLILSMTELTEVVIQTRADSMDGILTKLRMVFPELKDRFVPYPLVHEFFVPNELIQHLKR